MHRGYRYIQQYEKEIISLRNEYREIGERLRFNKEQIKGYFKIAHKSKGKLKQE